MSQIMSPYLLLVSPSNRSNKPATSSNANASRDIARKMVLTKDELLLWSSNIRGSRPPGKSEPSHFLDNLDYSSLMNLRALLGKLRYIKLTPEILKQTKMKEALTMIARGESRGWPPDIVSQARDLLRSWEAPPEHLNAAASQIKYVGRKIGGKVRRWADGGQHNLNQSPWFIRPTPKPAKAHNEGHLGFKIGSWWPNSLAACEAGIIDDPQWAITADIDVAYAILLTENREKQLPNGEGSRFFPYPGDRSVVKLMQTISGNHRIAVRVLRSGSLESPLAPTAGVRYDGLYRVASYRVDLHHDEETDKDILLYDFCLCRESDQEPIDVALSHPTSKELSAYKDHELERRLSEVYEEEFGDHVEDVFHDAEDIEEEIIDEMYEGMKKAAKEGLTILTAEDVVRKKRLESIDSGYFSPNPAAL
ncbi:MAG: hypothetical protein LQ342_005044 [Letrouitia transgressa]|nr:MAG: hypothetical protein LQ342_005044 [Letrouitia transgressa]